MKNNHSIFKHLFCEHRDKKCITNIHGDLINLLECRSVWECSKCGRRFNHEELDPTCNIVNFLIDKNKLSLSEVN